MAYVKFQLEDGTVVYIESTDTPKGSSGLIPSGRAADHAEQATESFDKSVDSISKVAAVLVENLRSGFTEPPSELSVNFGLKASADLGGLFISRGGMESNFNVAVRWHKDEKKNGASESSAEGGTEAVKDEKKTKAEG